MDWRRLFGFRPDDVFLSAYDPIAGLPAIGPGWATGIRTCAIDSAAVRPHTIPRQSTPVPDLGTFFNPSFQPLPATPLHPPTTAVLPYRPLGDRRGRPNRACPFLLWRPKYKLRPTNATHTRAPAPAPPRAKPFSRRNALKAGLDCQGIVMGHDPKPLKTRPSTPKLGSFRQIHWNTRSPVPRPPALQPIGFVSSISCKRSPTPDAPPIGFVSSNSMDAIPDPIQPPIPP